MASVAMLGFTFAACDNDDLNLSNNSEVVKSFNQLYPDATRVSWEAKGTYYVADFVSSGLEAEAWFFPDGRWQMTEIDIPYSALPAAVKTAFEASEYATWRVDDVDKVLRTGYDPIYVIDVEMGELEYDLYYAEDGVLIKAVADDDNNSQNYLPSTTPTSIDDYINTNYPEARILEIDRERDGSYEVDIISNGTHYELLFSSAGEWIWTTNEVRTLALPQAVGTALSNTISTTYPGYVADDEADFYVTATERYYVIEIERGESEVYLKITEDGASVTAIPEP